MESKPKQVGSFFCDVCLPVTSQTESSLSEAKPPPAEFYCQIDSLLLCKECFTKKDHKSHYGAESINNIVTSTFNKWRCLSE